MSSPTYAGTIGSYHRTFQVQVEANGTSLFIGLLRLPLNHVLLGAYLILVNSPTHCSQYLTLFTIVSLSLLNVQWGATVNMAYGIIVGISSSWCILVSANLLLLDRPLAEFQRQVDSKSPMKQSYTQENGAKSRTRWQSRPDGTYERLFWSLDFLGSLRGLHWSHGNLQDLHSNRQGPQGDMEARSLPKIIASLLFGYLSIDGLKEIIAMDPYFWGFTDAAPPEYISSVLSHAELIKAYRMLVAFAVFCSSIELVCAAGELIFVHVFGPSIAGTWGEQWAYQPQFGDFRAMCTKGLRGFWGNWWHQMFRFMLTSPATAMITKLNIPTESIVAKISRLTIPFVISGGIHACGSYRLWGNTRPLNSFLFFALQPLGIGLQSVVTLYFSQSSLKAKIPPRIRAMVNVGFTLIWLLKTFPLLVDDYSKGGLWLTEPFPFSLVQKIGLGSEARSQLF